MTGKLPFEKISPHVLIRQHASSHPNIASNPETRNIDQRLDFAIVNLDKPAGMTSRDAADCVNRILEIKKSGHSGTLDPAVTGVLPIGIGRATRVITAVLSAGKEYIATMRLHSRVDEQIIRKIFTDFTGIITQMPPVRSRVKRQLRKRIIYYMDILEILGHNVKFRVGCQAGTYIRKLVHDMGLTMNTNAHMSKLRRTKAGPFTVKNLCTLDDLQNAFDNYHKNNDPEELKNLLLPPEFAVSHMAHIWVDHGAIKPLSFGADLAAVGVIKLHDNISPGDPVALISMQNELIAIGTAKMTSQQILTAEKGIASTTDKVFWPKDNLNDQI